MSAMKDDGAVAAFAVIGASTAVVAAVMVLPLALLWKAYVLTKLWAWFVTPAIGLAPISIGYACGLLLLAGLLRSPGYRKPDESIKWYVHIGVMALLPLFGLCAGYIVHWFVS